MRFPTSHLRWLSLSLPIGLLSMACQQQFNPVAAHRVPATPEKPTPQNRLHQGKFGLPALPIVSCTTQPSSMEAWRQSYAKAFRQQWHNQIQQIRVPANAVTIQPGTSIQAAVDQHPPGTAFLLQAGTHRLQTIRPKAGMKFYGQQTNGKLRTILNGATQLTKIQREGRLYIVTNQTQSGQVHGQTQPGHSRAAHPEDLFINNQPLTHVDQKTKVGPGKWHFDYAANTVYFADNPEGKTIELSTQTVAFHPAAPDVTIAGLIIEKYANPAQSATIGATKAAPGWRVFGNEVRLNHGVGIRAGTQNIVRHNYIHTNGQLGIGANGQNILIEHNEIATNNFAKYDAGWEAGGSKFAFTTDLTVRRNLVYSNNGPGLWTDIDNRHTRYIENVVYQNASMGIFHEISYDAVIRDNYSAHNGRYDPWLYGSNIMVSTSKHVSIEGNTVEVNANYGNGIGIVWQNRGKDYRAERNRVENNTIRYYGTKGRSGVATDVDSAKRQIFQVNRLDNNHYYMPTASANYRYEWDNQQTNFDQLQKYGQEKNGREVRCSSDLQVNQLN